MCKKLSKGVRTPVSPAGASPSKSLVRSQYTAYFTAGLQTTRPSRRQDGAAFLVSRKRILEETEELWTPGHN